MSHQAKLLHSFAPIGQRSDFRRKNGDNSKPWERSGWRDKFPSMPSLPVSSSGVILIICVAVFLIKEALLRLYNSDFVDTYFALTPAYLLQRPWTLITHIFVHANFDHLFWNMLVLFFFGLALEQRVGEKRFLEIFMLSGIVGALVQMLVSSPYTTMLGASGAIYGVMGCLAIIAPEIQVLLFFVIPLRIQYAVVLFALIDFLMMGSGDSIAHMAHIAGLFVGLAFGYTMKRQPRYYNI